MADVPLPQRRPDTRQDSIAKANTLTALSAGAEALGRLGSGYAQYRSAALRATILRQNAATNRVSAEDAIVRGRIAAGNVRERTAQIISEQRAALAANGIVVDEGDALTLITDTAGIGAIDALTELQNAEREAAELIRKANLQDTEANVQRSAGRASLISGITSFGTTILGGANTIAERNKGLKIGGSS